jgi:hypothetical protein
MFGPGHFDLLGIFCKSCRNIIRFRYLKILEIQNQKGQATFSEISVHLGESWQRGLRLVPSLASDHLLGPAKFDRYYLPRPE